MQHKRTSSLVAKDRLYADRTSGSHRDHRHLAAILFPVFAQARERARAAACLSNVKQIGTGLMMYVQDYDEMYPRRSIRSRRSTTHAVATGSRLNSRSCPTSRTIRCVPAPTRTSSEVVPPTEFWDGQVRSGQARADGEQAQYYGYVGRINTRERAAGTGPSGSGGQPDPNTGIAGDWSRGLSMAAIEAPRT
jgi:hypothetical protein